MAGWVACIWRAPFTGLPLVLQPLGSGSLAQTVPRAITADGSTVVGAAYNGTHWKAAKWDTTTLAITLLDDILPSSDTTAVQISADGTVILGGPPIGSTDSEGEVGAGTPLIRWTGGGTSGSALPDRSSGTSAFDEWLLGPVMRRIISDDGSINVGGAAAADTSATKWTNGSPSGLIAGVGGPAAFANTISRDGGIVVGDVGDGTRIMESSRIQ